MDVSDRFHAVAKRIWENNTEMDPKEMEYRAWIGFNWLEIGALVNTEMNLWI